MSDLYRFGQFVLNPGRRTLSRADSTVSLTPKAFDVLLFLARNLKNRCATCGVSNQRESYQITASSSPLAQMVRGGRTFGRCGCGLLVVLELPPPGDALRHGRDRAGRRRQPNRRPCFRRRSEYCVAL